MRNLIYQYWDGDILPGVKASVYNIKKYAFRIGAKYLFEMNPKFVTNLGSYSPHYGSFKPIYNENFHTYDNVLFLDTDIFAVEGLQDNIFENFKAEIGICTEPFQPKHRAKLTKFICGKADEQWASIVETHWKVKMPRTEEGLLKVYNSGVVMYSHKGLLKAREKFIPFIEYVNLIKSKKLISFYTADQNYLHAMLQVAKIDYIELDKEWNEFIHMYYPGSQTTKKEIRDPRTENTKFVHIQASGFSNFDEHKLWRITNLPQDNWNL